MDLLQSPRTLWVVLAVALMAAAAFYSRSRGGVVAMLAATGAVAVVLVGAKRTAGVWAVGAGALVTAVLLAIWFGAAPVEERLSTVTQAQAAETSRLELWRHLWAEVPGSPAVGSGGGTCQFLELRHRTGRQSGLVFVQEFAHNEYLEALVEGGVVRLGLTLLLAGSVLGTAARWVRANPDHPDRPLVLGGLWGLTATAVHAGFEFGPHLPAIAALMLVSAAQVRAVIAPTLVATRNRAVCWGLAAALVPLAGFLVLDGWTSARADRYAQAARALERVGGPEARRDRAECWAAAAKLRPGDATYHQALGQTLLDAGDEAEGLRHLIAARDRCPVLAPPHVRLGERRVALAVGDEAAVYLERGARLAPGDPVVWYELGRRHLLDGHLESAWPAWRRCVELADEFVPAVAARAAEYLAPDELMAQVLPARPSALVAAAAVVSPDDAAGRRPFLERAAELLAGAESGADLWLRSGVEFELGRTEAAMASGQAALARESRRTEWRLEFAKRLRRADKLADAERELQTVLEQVPSNTEARDLLAVVARERKLRE